MRRCKVGWLRFTEDGYRQDPDVVRAELKSLALWMSSPAIDATFTFQVSQELDPTYLEEQRYRRHMFLARHGRQSVTQWANVPGREVRRYVAVLADMLREEHESAKRIANSNT